MRRRSLFWHLFPACLALSFAALLACGALASWHYRRAALAGAATGLETEARRLESLLAGRLAPEHAATVDSLCKALGRGAPARLTVILPDGVVLGDSEEAPRVMGGHGDRPEVVAALAGRVGVATRASPSQSRNLLYVAVPSRERPGSGRVAGAVRAALPLTAVDVPVRAFARRVAPLWFLFAALAAVTAAGLARGLARPLAALREGVDGLAAGDPGAWAVRAGPDEIANLAGALNRMAAALDARLSTAGRQRGEREAVLASMMEGVLAVDEQERVIELNLAAARLLRVEIPRALGRPLAEVARDADLRRFVGGVLAARASQEGEFRLDDPARTGGERVMQAHGTVLRDEAGRGIGALVVLNDVTRLRRLETVRREFVANVSHELKTPITAIKGFVETLIEGEAQDRGETQRYLEIVARQADRLNAIIEDLLALSRLEQEEAEASVELAVTAVRGPLQAALQVCEPLARERGIPVTLDCAPDLAARLNAALLEQAVINLVDNALKHSEADRPVLVAAARSAAGLEIRVRDGGCGIAREHLPRLFERFYRVDRGRSRRQGGTGLGLAIVKHIVKVHGGTVGVESAPGEGSTFTIVIP